MFFRSFLLGALFPSWGGLGVLFLSAILGYVLFGNAGIAWVPGLLIAASFIRPEAHVLLRGILYAVRLVCWTFAGVGFLTKFNHWSVAHNGLGPVLVTFVIGLAAHLRIRYMLKHSVAVTRLGTAF